MVCEDAMTMQAIDVDAILNFTGPVVRQPTHEGIAMRPEALSRLLARQRAAFLRNGPPSLAARRANLKKLRAALLARRADFEAALDADFGHRSDRKSTRLNSSHLGISYAVFCLKKNKNNNKTS